MAFEPSEARKAVQSDRITTACFSNRSHFMPSGTSLIHEPPERLPEFLAIQLGDSLAKATHEEQAEGAPLQERPLVRNAWPLPQGAPRATGRGPLVSPVRGRRPTP